jgi:4-amino-4-deoxy-L-arabinose transferase-like glycosyltransferase
MSAISTAPARAARPRVGAALGSRDGAALLALSLLALLLRLTDISRSLFTDEAFSLALAQRGFFHMLSLFAYEANGTLYSLVLWPLTRVIGTGEVAVRLPALVAGVASVPAMWWAARLLAGRRAAWVAAALLAINPMAVFYAQEARAYEPALLSAILAFGALAAACALPAGRRAWVGYVAAMLALAYCDLLAVPILLPAQALLVLRARRAVLRPWLISLIALGVGCVPLLVLSIVSRSRRNPLYWLPKTSKGLVKTAVEEFAGGQSPGTWIGLLTLALGVLLLAGAAWRLRGAGRARTGPRGTLLLAACWGVLPIVLLLAI